MAEKRFRELFKRLDIGRKARFFPLYIKQTHTPHGPAYPQTIRGAIDTYTVYIECCVQTIRIALLNVHLGLVAKYYAQRVS